MKEMKHYLDEAIATGKVRNDSETARNLGVSRAAVSDWRTGRNAPSDEQAIKLARLLGKQEIELMAEAAAARAKTPEARTYWERIAKYSATYASTAAMTIACSLTAISVTHSPESLAAPTEGTTRVFIMLSTAALGWGLFKLQNALSKIRRQPVPAGFTKRVS